MAPTPVSKLNTATRPHPRGDRVSANGSAKNRERLYDLIVRRSSVIGYCDLALTEMSTQTKIPAATIRRHLRVLMAMNRIVRVTGITRSAAESSDEKAMRLVGGLRNSPKFQPAMTCPSDNDLGVERLAREQAKLDDLAKRRAARKAAREATARLISAKRSVLA